MGSSILRRVALRQPHPFSCKTIEVRTFYFWMAIAPQFTSALIIRRKYGDVWIFGTMRLGWHPQRGSINQL